LLAEAFAIRKGLSTLYLAKPRWNVKAVLKKYDLFSYVDIKDLIIVIPVRTWASPEGSRRLKFPYFKTIGT
jgi:hypothetical protein